MRDPTRMTAKARAGASAVTLCEASTLRVEVKSRSVDVDKHLVAPLFCTLPSALLSQTALETSYSQYNVSHMLLRLPDARMQYA